MEKKTTIISAFPLCGKTYFSQNCGDFVVLDSDSSNFSWVKDANGNRTNKRNPDFPGNYIEHIKSNIGKADYILVSTHKEVRDALREAGIEYILVYPKPELLGEWQSRYRFRDYNGFPMSVMTNNWYDWIFQCWVDVKINGVRGIELCKDDFLMDAVEKYEYSNGFCLCDFDKETGAYQFDVDVNVHKMIERNLLAPHCDCLKIIYYKYRNQVVVIQRFNQYKIPAISMITPNERLKEALEMSILFLR